MLQIYYQGDIVKFNICEKNLSQLFLYFMYQFSSVQSLSRVRLLVTPWITALQASLSITKSWSLPKLNVHRVGDAIQPSHPLSSPSPPSLNLSQHQGQMSQLFASGGQSLELQFQRQYFQWKFSVDPIDRFDLLAAQWSLKSLFQHHNSKASIIL